MFKTRRATSRQSALSASASRRRIYVTACCSSYGVSAGSLGAKSETTGSSGGTAETPIGLEASIGRMLAALEPFSYSLARTVYRICALQSLNDCPNGASLESTRTIVENTPWKNTLQGAALGHGHPRGTGTEFEKASTSASLVAGGAGASRGNRPYLYQLARTKRVFGRD